MMAFLKFAMLAFASGGEGGGSLLDVNPGLIIWTVVTFVILLLILKKVAWKPILNSLSERENFIKESLDKAESARIEAEKLFEQNKANLEHAEEESQKIIDQGREYAEQLKNQIVVESKEEAKKIITDAAAEIERKNQEAFNSLKSQIADIAINAAEKIIRENLDKEKQEKLVDKYIEDDLINEYRDKIIKGEFVFKMSEKIFFNFINAYYSLTRENQRWPWTPLYGQPEQRVKL